MWKQLNWCSEKLTVLSPPPRQMRIQVYKEGKPLLITRVIMDTLVEDFSFSVCI